MKEYNLTRRLVKSVYGLIATELNNRYEVETFMKQGKMTVLEMYKVHKEFNGQTISTAEMEMMFAAAPSDPNNVNIYDFLHSRKGERTVYHEKYVQKVFAMLAEDASEAKPRIKKALAFAQNLSGDEKKIADGLVSVLDAIDDEIIPLQKFIEMIR